MQSKLQMLLGLLYQCCTVQQKQSVIIHYYSLLQQNQAMGKKGSCPFTWAFKGSGGIAPCSFNLSTRQHGQPHATATLAPEKDPKSSLNRRLGAPHSQSGCLENRRISSLPGIGTMDCLTCSRVLMCKWMLPYLLKTWQSRETYVVIIVKNSEINSGVILWCYPFLLN